MKILKTDSYISEKLGIKPVTKTRLIDIKETTVVATDDTLFNIVFDAIEKYGNDADLNFIQTYKVTNMCNLFESSEFNGDISKWDVSNVTNMSEMFEDSRFNGDISKWNVSNVRFMDYMFNGSAFNGDISRWDVSNVKDMRFMFEDSNFHGDLTLWNVSEDVYKERMFGHCPLEKYPPAWYK
jgi:surface protein